MPTDAVGQDAFAVIREAMRGKGMVALGRVVLSKREGVIALEPYEKGLLGTTLRYPYEVRKAADYFEAALPAVSRVAWAQAYPTRAVRIIVGFAAGGGGEIVHRASS